MHDAFACTRNFVCFVVSGTPHHHIFISCPLYPTPYTALLLTMMKFLRNTLILHCDENCVWIDRPDGHQHHLTSPTLPINLTQITTQIRPCYLKCRPHPHPPTCYLLSLS
eukprot:m.50377 g.50377  ORF g.50377 m.50377 type:complete len:110 (+) comp7509_c0_seq1:939-1268(+)